MKEVFTCQEVFEILMQACLPSLSRYPYPITR